LLNIYAARDLKFVAILDREKCILYRVFSKMQTKKERYAASPLFSTPEIYYLEGGEKKVKRAKPWIVFAL
jgi:hypothetical protein